MKQPKVFQITLTKMSPKKAIVKKSQAKAWRFRRKVVILHPHFVRAAFEPCNYV